MNLMKNSFRSFGLFMVLISISSCVEKPNQPSNAAGRQPSQGTPSQPDCSKLTSKASCEDASKHCRFNLWTSTCVPSWVKEGMVQKGQCHLVQDYICVSTTVTIEIVEKDPAGDAIKVIGSCRFNRAKDICEEAP